MILYIFNKDYGKIEFRNLIISVLVLIFGAVYEHFSYGVYSVYMIYAFAIPLLLGVLPFAVMLRFGKRFRLRQSGLKLYHFGIATLTVGSLVKGVLEIYGTTNSLTAFYWMSGALLVLAGLLCAFLPSKETDME